MTSVKRRRKTSDRSVAVQHPPAGGYSSVLRSHLGFCLYKCAIRLRGLLDQAFNDAGLITPQFGILSILFSNGSLSQNEISQKMGIDKATMVKLIDGLEKPGLVTRTAHATDRRVRIVELTAKGKATFNRLMEKAKKVELGFTERLTNAERETLRQLTSRLLE